MAADPTLVWAGVTVGTVLLLGGGLATLTQVSRPWDGSQPVLSRGRAGLLAGVLLPAVVLTFGYRLLAPDHGWPGGVVPGLPGRIGAAEPTAGPNAGSSTAPAGTGPSAGPSASSPAAPPAASAGSPVPPAGGDTAGTLSVTADGDKFHCDEGDRTYTLRVTATVSGGPIVTAQLHVRTTATTAHPMTVQGGTAVRNVEGLSGASTWWVEVTSTGGRRAVTSQYGVLPCK